MNKFSPIRYAGEPPLLFGELGFNNFHLQICALKNVVGHFAESLAPERSGRKNKREAQLFLMRILQRIYQQATGDLSRYTVDPVSSEVSGSFFKFVSSVFKAIGIKETDSTTAQKISSACNDISEEEQEFLDQFFPGSSS